MSKHGVTIRRLLLTAILASLSVGCGSKPTPPSSSGVSSPPTASSDATDIQVKVVDRDGYDAVISQHFGQVVLVDFWATWCLPCVDQFPHTVGLAKSKKERGLAVVSMSCDEPTELNNIRSFLEDRHATGMENLVSQFGGSPRTMEVFDVPNGAIPFYKLYDRKGELRQTFGLDLTAERPFTLGEIDDAVDALLAE